jgi:uncharacterized membrane protein YagU involved in acid resistance
MTQIEEREGASAWKGALAGFAGGLVASFVMDQFQAAWMSLTTDGKPSKQIPATEKAASAVSEGLFGHKLTKKERKLGGAAVHYAVGGVTSGIYGAAAEVAPTVTKGVGLPYGTAVWLVVDEGAVPALGLSKPVTNYPLSNHAYALASHFVFGVTADLVRRGVRKLL